MTLRYYLCKFKLISFVCFSILYSTASNADQTISEFIGNLGIRSSLGVPKLYLGMTKLEFDSVIKDRNVNGYWSDVKDSEGTIRFNFKSFYKEQTLSYTFNFENGILIEDELNFKISGIETTANSPARIMCDVDWDKFKSSAIDFYEHPTEPESRSRAFGNTDLIKADPYCKKLGCIPDSENSYIKESEIGFSKSNQNLKLTKEYIENSYSIFKLEANSKFIKRSCNVSLKNSFIPVDIVLSENTLVRNSNSNQPLPINLVDETQRYTPPALVNLETLQTCKNEADNDAYNFVDCVSENSLTGVQKKAYLCSKDYAQSKDKKALGLCLLKANMGENEQKAADIAIDCYNKYGIDTSKYPSCITEQVSDEKTARAVGCIKEQANSSDFSYWGLAVCYGAGELKMNPEATVAVECAMSSGGEPTAFLGCAGGRLTAMEFQKCIGDGIGNGGCLGENNELVKMRDKTFEPYRWVGEQLNDALGEGHEISKNWNNAVNDVSNGPGENNDAIKMIGNAANDFNNGPGKNNDLKKIADKIDEIIPGFSF